MIELHLINSGFTPYEVPGSNRPMFTKRHVAVQKSSDGNYFIYPECIPYTEKALDLILRFSTDRPKQNMHSPIWEGYGIFFSSENKESYYMWNGLNVLSERVEGAEWARFQIIGNVLSLCKMDLEGSMFPVSMIFFFIRDIDELASYLLLWADIEPRPPEFIGNTFEPGQYITLKKHIRENKYLPLYGSVYQVQDTYNGMVLTTELEHYFNQDYFKLSSLEEKVANTLLEKLEI